MAMRSRWKVWGLAVVLLASMNSGSHAGLFGSRSRRDDRSDEPREAAAPRDADWSNRAGDDPDEGVQRDRDRSRSSYGRREAMGPAQNDRDVRDGPGGRWEPAAADDRDPWDAPPERGSRRLRSMDSERAEEVPSRRSRSRREAPPTPSDDTADPAGTSLEDEARRHERHMQKLEGQLEAAELAGDARRVKSASWAMEQENERHSAALETMGRSARPRRGDRKGTLSSMFASERNERLDRGAPRGGEGPPPAEGREGGGPDREMGRGPREREMNPYAPSAGDRSRDGIPPEDRGSRPDERDDRYRPDLDGESDSRRPALNPLTQGRRTRWDDREGPASSGRDRSDGDPEQRPRRGSNSDRVAQSEAGIRRRW